MLANLLRRFTTREAAMATAAQLAVSWGANHLSAVIADQEEQIRLLTLSRDGYAADLERVTVERDEMRDLVDTITDTAALADAEPTVYAFTPMKPFAHHVHQPYPAPEDTDPLERGDDQADALADLEDQVNR